MQKDSNKKRAVLSCAALIAALMLALLVILGLGNCSLKTCGSSSGARYSNAIYIYMCGSTLETKSGTATKNISEILGANVPANTAIVIETGGTRKWRGYDIASDALVRYEVRAGKLLELEREQDANMGDAQTLSSFLDFCERDFPADNTTLLFWNHGAGSVKGVCLDEKHSMDALSATELNTALDNANAHFNTICFDACLMAGFETMRVVSHHANTMIASEEIEPAAGWDYSALIGGLSSNNLSEKVLSAYAARNETNGKQLYTLSAVDLKKFAQVESTFETFCDTVLSKKGSEGNLQEATQAASDAMRFGQSYERGVNTESNFVDLAQFSQNLGFSALSEAITNCTQTVNGPDCQGATGISIFFPFNSASTLENYLASATNETYAIFLRNNFGNNAASTHALEFANDGSVNGSFDCTALNFTITSESVKNVQEVAYAIYQLDVDNGGGNGEGGAGANEQGGGGSDESGSGGGNSTNAQANCLGFDNNIIERGAGAYTINFNGKWVALNGHLLSCDTIDTVGDTTMFCAAVKLNGTEGELRFTFTGKTGAYTLQGFVATEENETQGRLEDINPNDTLSILTEQFMDKESTETQYVETATINANDGLELTSVTLPNGRYQIYGVVTDLYGNEYTTRNFIVHFENGAIIQVETK